MEGMKRFPDKYFELAIVDPPYGHNKWKKNSPMGSSRILKYGNTNFNINPIDKTYMQELERVSRNRIIWGANYFPNLFGSSQGWIFWNKHQPVNNFADGEFAYTSFDIPAKCFDYPYYGNINVDIDGRTHPTQKPIKLYKWILSKYAKIGDKILDTHVGSASSLIACEDMGFEYVGYELDFDYYQAAQKRLTQYRSQLKLAI